MLNAEQFIDYKGLQGYAIQDMLKNANYNGTDTDWFNEYFNPSWSPQHTLTFQGGNKMGHYFASLNYVNQDGIIKGDKDLYKRLTAQLNSDYNLTDWLEVGNNISLEQWTTKSVSQQGYGSAFESLMTIDPCTPVYWTDPSQFNQDYRNKYNAVQAGTSEYPYSFLGDENGWFATSAIDETRGGSPFVQRDATEGSSQGINVHGVLFANLKPIKGLVITSRFGFRITQSNNHSYQAPFFSNGKADNKTYTLTATTNSGLYYQWENFANYNKTFANKHNLNVMAGMSFIKSRSDNVSGTATGSDILKGYDPNFRYLNYVKDDATKKFSNSPGESASLSYFGRLGYSYDNRYAIQANFRADAFDSSKLSAKNRWGYFPSVSAGWTISNESLIKDVIPVSTRGISITSMRLETSMDPPRMDLQTPTSPGRLPIRSMPVWMPASSITGFPLLSTGSARKPETCLCPIPPLRNTACQESPATPVMCSIPVSRPNSAGRMSSVTSVTASMQTSLI